MGTMKDYARELAELQEDLAEYKAQRKQIIKTGQSWRLRNGDDTREVTNVSLAQLDKLIAETERSIAQLERIVNGSSPSGIRVRAKVL